MYLYGCNPAAARSARYKILFSIENDPSLPIGRCLIEASPARIAGPSVPPFSSLHRRKSSLNPQLCSNAFANTRQSNAIRKDIFLAPKEISGTEGIDSIICRYSNSLRHNLRNLPCFGFLKLSNMQCLKVDITWALKYTCPE